jgi:hypothetical protein
LIAGRSDLQIATAVRGRNAVQCSAVQCGGCCCDASSVMGAKQKGEKEFGALCCGWGALRCMRENPTDPCVHAVQILWPEASRAKLHRLDTIHKKIRIRRARASRPALIVARRFPSGALTASCRCQAACPCRWTSSLLPSSPFVSTASTASAASRHRRHRRITPEAGYHRRQAASFHGYAIQCAIAHASEQDPD